MEVLPPQVVYVPVPVPVEVAREAEDQNAPPSEPERPPHPAVVEAEARARALAAKKAAEASEPPAPPQAGPVAPAGSADTGAAEESSLDNASLAWLLGLVAMLFAWWAWRRSHRLADEKERLDREQRRLRTAHWRLRERSAQLQQLVINDPLTGALNRLAFTNELRERADHLSRFGRPLHLIVFDLDHFKAINDRHGHLAGDAALKLVAGIVREHLDSDDLFGRFGGDEFLIACADQPLENVSALADRIREAVTAEAPAHAPPLPGLSLSMGIAQADAGTGYDTGALFARADAALYEAKRRGRNRVVLAGEAFERPPEEALGHRHL